MSWQRTIITGVLVAASVVLGLSGLPELAAAALGLAGGSIVPPGMGPKSKGGSLPIVLGLMILGHAGPAAATWSCQRPQYGFQTLQGQTPLALTFGVPVPDPINVPNPTYLQAHEQLMVYVQLLDDDSSISSIRFEIRTSYYSTTDWANMNRYPSCSVNFDGVWTCGTMKWNWNPQTQGKLFTIRLPISDEFMVGPIVTQVVGANLDDAIGMNTFICRGS